MIKLILFEIINLYCNRSVVYIRREDIKLLLDH
jgi:hypothetical protein